MNFEDISKKLKKFSKDTVTEVQKLNEIRQLNSRISDEKKQINRIYMEMGKKLYDLCKEDPMEDFQDQVRMVEEKYSIIDLLQDQIRGVKGVVLCGCCNTEVPAGERFCSNCGTRMPEVIKIEDNEEAEVVDGEVVDEADETVEVSDQEVTDEVAEDTETVSEETAAESEIVLEDPEDTEIAQEEAEVSSEAVEEAKVELEEPEKEVSE